MSTKKGIILAGGNGTRLYPATRAISKQLMPIYDKPMIYYPLSTLMLSGIRDILIITTPYDFPLFKRLLEDGSQWGISLSYAVQAEPKGLAEAFLIAKDFIGQDSVALILGDNLYYGQGLEQALKEAAKKEKGATVFSYRVANPENYGIVTYDKQKNPIDLIEKPENPTSNWAITGLYFYDNTVVDVVKNLTPSPRGELEITDVNRFYLRQKKLAVLSLGRGFAWLDTGTHESFVDATNFVRLVEQRQGLKIGCPEEIAYTNNFIDKEQLLRLASTLNGTGYADYLRGLVET
ncbi:MAG TPA: glucose-1-phosphate thymidylyltransferase [Rhodospirillaceae bacterium]|nr:glucose-1-phosphate thymidylyltransferase [Rhodospirillaceae bacterium]